MSASAASARDPELALRISAIVQEHGGALLDRGAMRADIRGLIAWDRARRASMLMQLAAEIVDTVLDCAGLVPSHQRRQQSIALVREHLAAAMPGEREG